VIFGLMVATFLTLVVVPTLFYLQQRLLAESARLRRWLHDRYWGLYDRLAGQRPQQRH
jgi:multidrug efflux pump